MLFVDAQGLGQTKRVSVIMSHAAEECNNDRIIVCKLLSLHPLLLVRVCVYVQKINIIRSIIVQLIFIDDTYVQSLCLSYYYY